MTIKLIKKSGAYLEPGKTSMMELSATIGND